MFIATSLALVIVACSLPSTPPPTDIIEPVNPVAPPAVEFATQEAPPPAQPAAIEHQVIPVNLPASQNGQAGDFDSSAVLERNSLIGGDRFTFGRFERPFNAYDMDVYYSQIDIVDTKVFQDDTWIFGVITLKELKASSSASEKYAIELDTDVNGKGDWLVITTKPESTEWTVKGVQVYQDANRDVGGEQPSLTDNVPPGGDGFETMVFDQGQGDDADSAWVRISPNNPNTIEIAVKRSVLGNPTSYMINMWAGTSLLAPELFDINDRFTHEQAGAADKGLEFFYPIKEVAEIDNSCRMAVGFIPTGAEAGICPVPQKEKQGDPVPPGTTCPPGTFLFCSPNIQGTGCFCFPILVLPTPIPPVP